MSLSPSTLAVLVVVEAAAVLVVVEAAEEAAVR